MENNEQQNSDIPFTDSTDIDNLSVNDFLDSVDSWETMLAKKCTATCSHYSSSNRDTTCTFV